MDYDLARTVQGRMEYSLDQAMPFGEMPSAMLMAKYEETDVGPDEHLYENYSRETLIDRRPDPASFAHEEARGAVNARAGRIELQYYGHRGTADDPYRPEHFDGFIGDEDRDPRGINVDPDMKELRAQHEARNRFINLTPDHSEHITGGGRSEGKIMADQQQLFKDVRGRLKIFSRQLDGPRNGLSRAYQRKSAISKQTMAQSYGDMIKDYALTPQRRVNMICKQVLRESKLYRDECMDADFAFARYAQTSRRARARGPEHSSALDFEMDNKVSAPEDPSMCYKTVGILLSNIVKCKKQVMVAGDTDFATVRASAIRKSEPFVKDLTYVIRSMATGGNFGTSTHSSHFHTASPVIREHLARTTVSNHLEPAHHYVNAEIIYKNVKPGEDTRKIKDQIISDVRTMTLKDGDRTAKSVKMKMVAGAKLATAEDIDHSESKSTYNYRTHAIINGDRRIRLDAQDRKPSESSNTQVRRQDHTQYRATGPADVEHNMRYGDNTVKERLGGHLGSKYLNRYIDRDNSNGEISMTN